MEDDDVMGQYDPEETITISEEDILDIDLADPFWNSMGSTITSTGSVGSTLTSGSNGSYWSTSGSLTSSIGSIGNNSTITIGNNSMSGSVHVVGDNPKIKIDGDEIDLRELAATMKVMKDILEASQMPIPDTLLRDKHEILQRAWDDVKSAYENYRITEALLREPNNDQ